MSFHLTVHRRQRLMAQPPEPLPSADDRLPRSRVSVWELLAFVLGVHESQRLDDGPEPVRPVQAAAAGTSHAPRPPRPGAVAGPVRLRAPLRITAVHLHRDRRTGPTQAVRAAGLAPAAHTAPPRERLAWSAGDVDSTMAMPRIDLDRMVDGPFEDRLAAVTFAVDRGLHAVHENAVGAVDYHLECWKQQRDRFDDFAIQLWRDEPEPVAAPCAPSCAPAATAPPDVARYEDVPVPFATGRRRRAPGPQRPTVAGLFPALPAAPARHALPGGSR